MVENRLLNLDLYRAFGVILMVIFHFTYDLHHFGFSDIDTTKSLFWIHLRTFIVAIFMSAVGMSLYLVYSKTFDVKKYVKRLTLLGSASLVVSVVTFFMFPHTWIYFGVLHMIFVASLIGPFFVKKPNVSGVLGLVIVALYLLDYRMHPLFTLLQEPLHLPPGHTEDLASFIPWFGAVLLGIFVMHYRVLERLPVCESVNIRQFSMIGRHSLLIYLVHQPLLFAILGTLHYFVVQ
ncbi:MAG TPA: DUF1624 domain-containing protein [Helicobacteraceae bacterium]|nr:DUF1624 domain-containing protein [Helicobacteraceae bacterium]